MKSPFPGMDPYIEACGWWEGFHNHLVEAIYQSVATVLPSGYTADTPVRSYIVLVEAEGKKERLVKPDIAVTHPAGGKKPKKGKGGVAVVEKSEAAEFVQMRAFIAERVEETFVEIYAEREERILVTCIEVLSPSNKRRGSEGWCEYERKRQAMLLGRANFIEIDLLRGGNKMPMLDPWPDSPYSLLVCRQSSAPYCRVWPATFQRRMPPIPVPLLDPDPDLTLDLQPLLDHIYSLGRYHERLDYARSLTPALPDAEAVWVRDVLKDRTPRTGRKGRPST